MAPPTDMQAGLFHTPTRAPPMSHAAATTPTVTGTLVEAGESRIVLALPGTDYKLHLAVGAKLPHKVGGRVSGTIHARAKRADVIRAGGRFVEPGTGRPRRVQGRLIGGDASANTVTVQAGPGIALVCELTDQRQKVADFTLHQMVSFDVEPGATFRPEG